MTVLVLGTVSQVSLSILATGLLNILSDPGHACCRHKNPLTMTGMTVCFAAMVQGILANSSRPKASAAATITAQGLDEVGWGNGELLAKDINLRWKGNNFESWYMVKYYSQQWAAKIKIKKKTLRKEGMFEDWRDLWGIFLAKPEFIYWNYNVCVYYVLIYCAFRFCRDA